MRRLLLRTCALIFILPCLLFSQEETETEEEPDIIVFPKTAVLNQDFFTSGKNIEISGTVNGDVYVLGGRVFIDGTVNGDILVAGGSIEMSGQVTKDIRVLAGQVLISGKVGRNVTAITATIEFAPSAQIGGNIITLSGNVDLKGKIDQNARIYAANLRISDTIRGKLYAYVGQMRITSKANIKQGIEYWSNKDALIDSHADIKGGVIHHPSFFYNFFHGKILKSVKIGSKFAVLIMNFFYTLVIAFIMLRYFPERAEKTLEVLTHKPLQSLIAGIVLVILLPLTFLALLITIVGIPFALTLLAINVISFYSAKILTILWGAKYLFIRFDFFKHKYLYFTFGLIIYYALNLIPYLGMVLSIIVLLFGLGGLVLGKINDTRQPKKT